MPSQVNAYLLKFIKYGVIFLIVSMPFYAFLTVYGGYLFGHYTALRLYKETLLVLLMFASIYLVSTDRKLAKIFFGDKIIRLIILFAFIALLWGVVSYLRGGVSLKAFGYGLIVDLRIFLIFAVSYLISLKIKLSETKLLKYILYPALAVVGFGLMQIFVLPHDFLSHFGYSIKTIMPYETINNNSQYVRIISFLRGSNPLGTYLIIPLSTLALVFINKSKLRFKSGLFFIMTSVVLLFSFSRSAWIGAVVSVGLVIYLKISSQVVKKRLLYLVSAGFILSVISLFIFKNNSVYQNLIFHTQTTSVSNPSSDTGHLNGLSNGLHQIISNPIGSGTGTAGPASVYNKKAPVRIAENFFIQIGQELGIIGLLVFIVIQVLLAVKLYKTKSDFGVIMLASLIGISLVNLLSHAWADDSLAYIWWGLAGFALK